MSWLNLVPIFKYTSSFIFLSFLTLCLIYMIQKIRCIFTSSIIYLNIFNLAIRRSLNNKDSLFVIFFTLFGCFMVVYVILLGGGYMTGLWLQGNRIKKKCTENKIYFVDVNDTSPDADEKSPCPFRVKRNINNIALYSLLLVQNIFYIPSNLYLLNSWYWNGNFRYCQVHFFGHKHHHTLFRSKHSVNKFIWMQRLIVSICDSICSYLIHHQSCCGFIFCGDSFGLWYTSWTYP